MLLGHGRFEKGLPSRGGGNIEHCTEDAILWKTWARKNVQLGGKGKDAFWEAEADGKIFSGEAKSPTIFPHGARLLSSCLRKMDKPSRSALQEKRRELLGRERKKKVSSMREGGQHPERKEQPVREDGLSERKERSNEGKNKTWLSSSAIEGKEGRILRQTGKEHF